MALKNKRQSEQERISSEYIPIKPEDARMSVEVPVKQVPESKIITIEKKGKSKVGKLRPRKITSSAGIEKVETSESLDSDSAQKFSISDKVRKSRLKPGEGYILIITEKPQAAAKIASALGNAKKLVEKTVPYYELERDNKKIVVACAVGHLFGLKQKKGEKGWPIFNIEWAPNFEKSAWTKKYYDVLVKLVKNASEFIVATDYDIEGEVIGWNIVRFIAKQKDAKRMKFSSLTGKELEEAYDNPSPTLNWGQAIAGETRHYLDWMYGINFSRALMEAIKSAGSFKIMSIGRVQGPALNLIVHREREILAFNPEPYWQVFITVEGIELKYNRDITNKADLIPFQNLKNKQVLVSTEKSEQNIKPPAPFDLTTLQTEAYKFFGITPSRTLQIAQGLYLAGLISYPRTSSQKIPDSISPLSIIKRLGKVYDTKLCVNKKPVEGNKSDPAHPSIYPTGEFASVEGEDKKIYDLIVRRFLACFCESAILANKTITALYENYRFIAKGMEILKKAWMEVYKTKLQERELPDLNGTYIIQDSRIEEKETQPPKRYTPASLVRELEKRNLGTKSTRSSIVETLYSRGYIQNQSIQATSIGMALISSLEKHSPIIIDEQLTRKFEKEMEQIQEAKKDLSQKEERILEEAKSTIQKISEEFKKDQVEIGKELLTATQTLREQERQANELQICPKCQKNKLRILYNKALRRYFVACSGYPECKTTFSLPPNSLIKPSRDREDRTECCDKCQFPLLLAIRKGKRPWKFCFNEKNHSDFKGFSRDRKIQTQE
ncbi:MAG: DNA topoisomerase I [Nanoarchaeota archaeon]|nr:DNA topoisomerase I [Nanoarchaeota archaeon]MBU4086302.1 DNA topoisomerase I [Nanoarchaeota archaeon]